MELSVVILNYKVPAHLLLCVDSVVKAVAEMDAEIIVADNNSEDESLTLLSQFFPKVKQLPIAENLGFSKANNLAVAQAKGEYICLLNPDTLVAEDTFKKALEFAKKKTDVGALGVQLIDGSGHFLPESKRNIPTPKVALAKLLGFQKSYYANQVDTDEVGEVEVLVGAFMLMKNHRYHQVGGLDEAYFMYGEDIDLSFQFLKHGFRNYYLGSISCLHFKGESTIKDQKFRKRFFGAMQLFYQKHFQTNRISLVFVRLALQFAQGFNLGVSASKQDVQHIKKYWLFSENEELLKKLPSAMQGKLVNSEDKFSLKDLQGILIFDANYLSYKDIIQKMKDLAYTDLKFRIIPRTEQFMLGSDSITLQGEVIYFGDR